MTEILHAWAIAPAAVGTCCLAADRGRVRWPEIAASLVMLLAMLDASLGRVVPSVLWALLLIGAAIALAALRAPRRTASRFAARPGDGGMIVHTSLGMIAMAALQVAMTPAGSTSIPTSHAHGGVGVIDALLLIGALAYAVFSAELVRQAHAWLDRARDVAMGSAVVVMAWGAVT